MDNISLSLKKKLLVFSILTSIAWLLCSLLNLSFLIINIVNHEIRNIPIDPAAYIQDLVFILTAMLFTHELLKIISTVREIRKESKKIKKDNKVEN